MKPTKSNMVGGAWIWLTGCTVAASLLLVVGLIGLIAYNGLSFFWPKTVEQLELVDGTKLLAIQTASESVNGVKKYQFKQANRDDYGIDFRWVDEAQLKERSVKSSAAIVERLEWGNYHGVLHSIRPASGSEISGANAWAGLIEEVDRVTDVRGQIHHLEKSEIGKISDQQEALRLQRKRIERLDLAESKLTEIEREEQELQSRFEKIEAQIADLRKSIEGVAVFEKPAGGGALKNIELSTIVRAYRPNQMSFFDKIVFYIAKVKEFIVEDPRESNTEGGVFPAIFGTVMMVFIMTIVVTPVGVLAAIYLREYAKQGKLVSLVRIAVNNLAGVPSIVFGVFGVGFFIYFVGGGIDQFFYADKLPAPTYGTGGILWASLTLALLTVPTVIVATEEGLAAVPRHLREGSYALGATKFETTIKVVLPCLMPSILTGMILSIARAAGEVAPLMITGVVKLAPSLPIDGSFPYFHLERKFMHLGFHIYDVGFQSPNVDAARPMVYSTTLLLLLIVIGLNLIALVARNRLRKKFATSAV